MQRIIALRREIAIDCYQILHAAHFARQHDTVVLQSQPFGVPRTIQSRRNQRAARDNRRRFRKRLTRNTSSTASVPSGCRLLVRQPEMAIYGICRAKPGRVNWDRMHGDLRRFEQTCLHNKRSTTYLILALLGWWLPIDQVLSFPAGPTVNCTKARTFFTSDPPTHPSSRQYEPPASS